jgi:hypothetical protein
VLGPVDIARHTPPSISSFVLSEAIGTAFVCLSVFGSVQRIPSTTSRLINALAFFMVGSALVVVSFLELRRMSASYGIGITTFVLTGAALIGPHLFRSAKFRGSATWPTTQGTIEASNVREVRTRSGHCYLAEMSYSYLIDNEYYSGGFTREFESESEAWDYANEARTKNVVVKFNSKKPDCSRVEKAPL